MKYFKQFDEDWDHFQWFYKCEQDIPELQIVHPPPQMPIWPSAQNFVKTSPLYSLASFGEIFEFYQFELFLTYFHLNRVSMLSHKCSYHHQLFDLISKGTHQRKFTFGDQPKCQVLHKIQLGPNLIHSGQST